mgnify:CR=1 FL=1
MHGQWTLNDNDDDDDDDMPTVLAHGKQISVGAARITATQCHTPTVWYALPLLQSLQYFQSCNII